MNCIKSESLRAYKKRASDITTGWLCLRKSTPLPLNAGEEKTGIRDQLDFKLTGVSKKMWIMWEKEWRKK
jgi:hypothetical protein